MATADPAPSGVPKYFPALDGLRLFCYLCVATNHAFSDAQIHQNAAHPLAFMRDFMANLGRPGVDVFFTLSGFLITKLLLEEREKHGRIDLKAFYARRTLRIWPVYYTALGVAVLASVLFGPRFLLPLGCTESPRLYRVIYPAFALFVGNYVEGSLPSPINVLWSLCVEEQFYVLFPATFAFAARKAPVTHVVMVYAIASYLLRAGAYAAGWNVARLWHVTSWADNLLIGAALAQALMVAPQALISRMKRLGLTGEVLAILTVLGSAFFDRVPETLSMGAFSPYLLEPYATGLLVAVIGLGDGPVARFMSRRPLRYLGGLTYAAYVFHEYGEAIGWRILRIPGMDRWLVASLRAVIASALGLLFASGSKLLIEDRFAGLKKRFSRT